MTGPTPPRSGRRHAHPRPFHLRRPSHYARFPVIRLELDLGELEAWPTGKLGKGFVDGLIEALPGLAEHGCSYRNPAASSAA